MGAIDSCTFHNQFGGKSLGCEKALHQHELRRVGIVGSFPPRQKEASTSLLRRDLRCHQFFGQ